MRTGARSKAGLLVLAWAGAAFACGQSGPSKPSAPADGNGDSQTARSTMQPRGEILREIDDPHTGDRWMLMRDAANPAGPGRVVLVEDREATGGHRTAADARQISGSAAHATGLPPVIRAGDALIVEEHTSVVDARLEAVALGPAAMGAEFRARLKVGGKVVRVVAVAAGRAALAPESEGWR